VVWYIVEVHLSESFFINTLFTEAIGFYNMPIASFFICEVIEVVKLLEKMRDRLKFEHELQYIAICNALGKNFSKNYKYFDVFEKKENKKKEVSEEEKEELKSYFSNW
jgi:hypothetical protein